MSSSRQKFPSLTGVGAVLFIQKVFNRGFSRPRASLRHTTACAKQSLEEQSYE